MQKSLTNVQILRAFAALNVVVFHSIDTAQSYSMSAGLYAALDNWGKNGVDLFFVISGFIMVYIQRLKSRSALDFMRDRVLRIVPTYWMMSLFLAALLIVAPTVFREMDFSLDWLLGSLFFVSNILFDREPILFLGWTIEYEMFFYAVFALSLLLSTLDKSVLATVLALSCAAWYSYSSLILLEFVFGILIGWWYVNRQTSRSVAIAAFLLGSVAFLASVLYKDAEISRVVIYGIPSACIVFGLVNMAQYENKILSGLGDASYGIYLIQVFTIPFFFKVIGFTGLQKLPGELVITGSFIFSTICGYCFYRFVEVWTQKKIKSLIA
jgi:exopolysaccharide production protein ExoZ